MDEGRGEKVAENEERSVVYGRGLEDSKEDRRTKRRPFLVVWAHRPCRAWQSGRGPQLHVSHHHVGMKGRGGEGRGKKGRSVVTDNRQN